MAHSEENVMARLAVLESTVRECVPMLDRVIVLEADMRHLSTEMDGLKEAQERNRKERQEQFEILLGKMGQVIDQVETRFVRDVQPLAKNVDALYTGMKTLGILAGFVAGFVGIVVGVLSVWPS